MREDLLNLVHTRAHLKSTALLHGPRVKLLPPGSWPNCLWTHKHGCWPKYHTHYWRYRKVRPDRESRPLSTAAQLTARQRNVSKQQNLCLQTSFDTPLCIRAFFLDERYIPFSTRTLTPTDTESTSRPAKGSLRSRARGRRGAGGTTGDMHPLPSPLGLQAVARSQAGLGDHLLPAGKAYRQMTFNPTSSAVPVSQKSP